MTLVVCPLNRLFKDIGKSKVDRFTSYTFKTIIFSSL